MVDILTFLVYKVNLSNSLLMIYYKLLDRLWPKPRIWTNPDYDSIKLIVTSIATFTNSDICKWRVALLQQEKLTRSGATDSSAFLLVSIFTSQCLFCPFWHFGPNWLSVKVLCWKAWCHILGGDIHFIFTFLYFNVGCYHVCHCLGTGW